MQLLLRLLHRDASTRELAWRDDTTPHGRDLLSYGDRLAPIDLYELVSNMTGAKCLLNVILSAITTQTCLGHFDKLLKHGCCRAILMSYCRRRV